jgi:hypothetical protein
MVFTNSTGLLRVERLAVGLSATTPTSDGTINAEGDVVAYATSDKKLKENIQNIKDAVSKLDQLRGVEYDWKEGFEKIHPYSGHDIGIIAQELEPIFPDAVTTRANGYKAVKYEKLVAVLIEGIKELNTEINVLKEKVKTLENK